MKNKYFPFFLIFLSLVFSIHIGTVVLKKIKWDSTEEKLYSLSEGTVKILNKLNTPIELKLYYSKTAANKGVEGLRQFNNYFNYVQDFLAEYAAQSKNKIKIQVIDPRPDTEDEEKALEAGLKKFQITGTETYFFGLVAENNNGHQELIEFIDPNEKHNFEYQVTKLIYKSLEHPKNKIGLISSLPMVSNAPNPYVAQMMRIQGQEVKESWFAIKMLQETSEVKQLPMENEQIKGIDLLIVVHPKDIPLKTISAIEKFVGEGGKLLVLIDPNLTTDQALLAQGIFSTSPNNEFNDLLKKFGVSVDIGKLAGDKSLAGLGQASPESPPMKLLPLVGCNLECVNPYGDVISSGLDKLRWIFPGVLKLEPKEGIKITPLVTTTNKGNTYQAGAHDMNHPEALLEKFTEGNTALNLAIKSVGKWGSAESAVIVMADVDFIEDQFAFQQTLLGPSISNDNVKLFLNAADSLVGSTDLLSVRVKGIKDRSFDVVDGIEKDSEQKTLSKVSEINQSILKFQQEIDSITRKAESGGDIALLKSETLERKKELNKQMIALKKELREVKRAGREGVETLGKFFQSLNTLFLPIVVVIVGFFINKRRYQKYSEVQK